MAGGDDKPSDDGGENSPAPQKPDLRVGSHDDMGVRVSRDLRGTGGNARGHGANFSKMSFSSRGLPRDEVGDDLDPAPATPVAAAPVKPPAPAATPAVSAKPAGGGVLSWLTELFTRR